MNKVLILNKIFILATLILIPTKLILADSATDSYDYILQDYDFSEPSEPAAELPDDDHQMAPSAPEPDDVERMEREAEAAADAYEEYLSSLDTDGDTVNDLDDNCPDLPGDPDCNGCNCPPEPTMNDCEGGDEDGDGWCADDACPSQYGLDSGCPIDDIFPGYDDYHYDLNEDNEWEFVGIG